MMLLGLKSLKVTQGTWYEVLIRIKKMVGSDLQVLNGYSQENKSD